jgi:hypothetical protein
MDYLLNNLLTEPRGSVSSTQRREPSELEFFKVFEIDEDTFFYNVLTCGIEHS